ncbi:hypothetical protein [uncultured Rubinisphaera sp.]|uniref:hypothetical protein n=1 Tax=uncultured Rubinisphaera sp. TaxID=1678686 RepID=UPI0030D7A8E8
MKKPYTHYKLGLLFSLLTIVLPAVAYAEKPQSESLKGLPLIATEDFEHGTRDWKPTDNSAWEIQQEGNNHVFSLIKKKSNYEPPVRSPYNRAIYQGGEFADVILDLKLQSTSPDYNHRSLCLFFGYQDESHFYYVHFGKKTDDHANQIFIVNDAPRTKISTKTTPGTNWDDEWHHARVIRKVQEGTIEIYFDNMETPIMTATDKTFQHGRIGIGSFDDPGRFDDIKIYGNPIK